MRHFKISSHFIAILTIAIWGETFISTKLLLHAGLSPADIFMYRFSIAYICTLVICHDHLFAQNWKDELRFILIGALGGSLYFLTENESLVHAQASDVSIIVTSCPIITSIIMALFYKSERLVPRQYLGLIVAFIGIIFVILNGKFILHISPLGYMLALGAALCWAFYSLVIKGIVNKYSIWFINRKTFIYGLLTIIPYYFLVSPLQTDTAILFQPAVCANIIYLGLVASMLCFVMWTYAMKEIGTVRVSVYMYLNPLFTVFFAVIILHETITWMALAGLFILILGMIMAEKK